MTTAQTTKSPANEDWNERIINLLIALGSGHSVRASGASSLMIYTGKNLAAEVQLGEPIHVSVWLTFRVGSEADDLNNPELRRRGEAALEDVYPTWAVKGFERSEDEYLDHLNPDDPAVVFIARLDAVVHEFDEAVQLVQWALKQERKFNGLEGA
jgi:hypothetical protein